MRAGGSTIKKLKFNRQEVSNNEFLWENNAVSRLDGHVPVASCLFQKATRWWDINETVTWREWIWQCMARNLALGVTNFFISVMITLKIAWFSQYCTNLNLTRWTKACLSVGLKLRIFLISKWIFCILDTRYFKNCVIWWKQWTS